jgi:hypothetical protein
MINFLIRGYELRHLYVVRWTHTLEQKSCNYRIHTYLCLIVFYDKVCVFHVKIIGLSSLESLLPF